jgi:hypothetical protein
VNNCQNRKIKNLQKAATDVYKKQQLAEICSKCGKTKSAVGQHESCKNPFVSNGTLLFLQISKEKFRFGV